MVIPEPVRRTAEIEEATNSYVIHPIAGWLTPLLARFKVSPNAVSLTGMACGIAAGFAYCHYRNFAFAVVGLALMVTWHVLDGADGQLARLTQRQSQAGKVLDGICDYITFASVYIGLAWALSRDHSAWIWGLVVLAGLCHAVQAATYEAQRQAYEFWGLGKNAARPMNLCSSAHAGVTKPLVHRAGDRLHSFYGKVQSVATGADVPLQRRLMAFIEASPEQTAAIRSWYRELFAPSVRRWSIMSANYRTLAIFFFCSIKAPAFYFIFETFGLTALLGILLSGQRRRYAMLFEVLHEPNRVPYSAMPASDWAIKGRVQGL